MKKFLFILLVVIFCQMEGWAEPAWVYKSETDFRAGKSAMGNLMGDQVLVSASHVVGMSSGPIVGLLSGEVRRGQLIRLDNELDVALVRLGEPISSSEFQKVQQARSAAIRDFLPKNGDFLAASGSVGAIIPASLEAFLVKVSGTESSGEPILIRKFRKGAETELELVRLSTTPVWNIEVSVHSEPKHFFWKKTDTRGLTQVPKETLEYSQQFFIVPMRNGSRVRIPLELSSLKNDSYEWTISVKTKAETWEKKIPIKFE